MALVTGAGKGVGRATALLFAQAGASVVVNDFHIDRAKAVADEIEAFGGVAMAWQADITNLASVEAMTSEAIARFGRIDILVNNARSEEHTSEIQSLMRTSYDVFCLKKTKTDS